MFSSGFGLEPQAAFTAIVVFRDFSRAGHGVFFGPCRLPFQARGACLHSV